MKYKLLQKFSKLHMELYNQYKFNQYYFQIIQVDMLLDMYYQYLSTYQHYKMYKSQQQLSKLHKLNYIINKYYLMKLHMYQQYMMLHKLQFKIINNCLDYIMNIDYYLIQYRQCMQDYMLRKIHQFHKSYFHNYLRMYNYL